MKGIDEKIKIYEKEFSESIKKRDVSSARIANDQAYTLAFIGYRAYRMELMTASQDKQAMIRLKINYYIDLMDSLKKCWYYFIDRINNDKEES